MAGLSGNDLLSENASQPLDLPQSLAPQEIPFLSSGQLVKLWKERGQGRCYGEPQTYLRLADRAIDFGEFLLAYDILKEGLHYYPGQAGLWRRQAHAMQRNGAVSSAVSVLEKLLADDSSDEEISGQLASCYKDLWYQCTDPEEARRWLVKARDTYAHCFHLKAGYWPAINLATVSAYLGQSQQSLVYATQARNQCLALLDTAQADEKYWILATIAEAYLLARDLKKAEQYYSEARAMAGGRLGRIRSTRANANLILRQLHCSESERRDLVQRCLDMPRVVVFTGHRIDLPGRNPPRFPPHLEQAAAARIDAALASLNCGFGYASAACGGDILFLEALFRRHVEANIVLPCEVERFLQYSVTPHGGNWTQRFRNLLSSHGARVTIVSQGLIDERIGTEYANRFAFGLAGIRANRWGTNLSTLAVWDGKTGDGPGGTQHTVDHWRACGCEPTIINPQSLLKSIDPPGVEPVRQAASPVITNSNHDGTPAPATEPEAPEARYQPRMVALVFTDLVGYSALSETEIPQFIQHVIDPVTRLAHVDGRSPLHMSTWGDCFFAVFETVAQAAGYALDLQDMMVRTPWLEAGFRAPLAARTALHFGPVYCYTNPTSGETDFIGTHVTHAARMEPITPPNHVYASEVFAAVAFAEGAQPFSCDYVGQIGLAKNYGICPAYGVRRSRSAQVERP